MKNIVFQLPCVACVILFAAAAFAEQQNPGGQDDVPKAVRARCEEPARLLTRWCDGMIAHQLEFPHDRGLDGAMVCSACGHLHGRIGDAVYPFVVQWDRTGDGKYLKAARKAIAWCEANMLCADGSYQNDYMTPWNFITVFSQMAIGRTLRQFGEKLPADFRSQLESIYERQTKWLFDRFQEQRTYTRIGVNYLCSYAEAMAEAGHRLNEPKYVDEARKAVGKLRPLVSPEGLLIGECVPMELRTPARGLGGVDIGYNLEEALPAMLATAEELKDEEFASVVVESAKAHLEFMLPDGAIDNSAGSRAYKWSYSGSRTADGVLPLLAMLEKRGVKWARRAAERVVGLHARLTGDDGLLYGGLYYRDAGEPACLHHTFTHAKALAEYVVMAQGASGHAGDEPMPRELGNRVVRHPTMDVELASVGPWRATFSASDAYIFPGVARRLTVGGGSPTLLWHEKAGLLLAATQADFFYAEQTNQQETRRERTILSTTPRLETADGFSSVQDFDVKVKSDLENGVYSYRAEGVLTSLSGEKGQAFTLDYALDENGFSVRAKAAASCRYYLPVVGGNDTEIDVSGNRATVRRNGQRFVVTSSVPLEVRRTERGDRSFTTICGLMTEHLFVELNPDMELVLSLRADAPSEQRTSDEQQIPCEQFDVSKVVRGKGEVEVACAAIEKRFSTSAHKHFFGLRTPAAFAVEIPLGGDALMFEASCGVDKSGAQGAVVLRVLGDGKELWVSPPTAFGDKEEVKAKVNVTGVKAMTLAVDPVDGTGEGVFAVWGEAHVTYRGGAMLPNDVRRTSRQLGVLTPPAAKSPRVNGPRVYGVRPGKPILYRVPVTGERPVKLKVQSSKVKVETARRDAPIAPQTGLFFDPDTHVITGSIKEAGEYPVTIVAENASGRDEKQLIIKVGDKIGLTPALGWSSWNAFGGSVSDAKVRAAADALVATGLADHGYSYVNIDDFWQNIPERAKEDPDLEGPLRDSDGRIAANRRFPDMKGLVDYIHGKGLKAGIYSSPGPFTCGRAAGSWQHEEFDAKTFADWGFDYLKHDWCFYDDVAFGKGLDRAMYPYLVMGRALARQDRDIYFSLCQYGMENVSAWGRLVGAQSWRTTGDVFDTWSSVSAAIEKQKKLFYYTEPGAWNDPDMLCVGNVCWNGGNPSRLAPNEQYTHVSLWSLLAAPMLIGCDLEKIDPFTLSLLSNDEVIEIDQDPLGKGAGCIAEGNEWEIWARPLSDGSVAAGLYNKSNREQVVPFDLEAAGLMCKWRVRDVWRQEDVGVFLGKYESSVPGHATHLVRLFPLPCGHLRKVMGDVRENAWRLLREKDLKSAK